MTVTQDREVYDIKRNQEYVS